MQGHELMAGVPDADLSVCGPLARDPRDLQLAMQIMAQPAGRQAVGWQLNLPQVLAGVVTWVESSRMGERCDGARE